MPPAARIRQDAVVVLERERRRVDDGDALERRAAARAERAGEELRRELGRPDAALPPRAPEGLVGGGELAGRDGRHRRQLEREREAADDLREASYLPGPVAAHDAQGVTLRGQVRPTPDRADDEAREHERRVDPSVTPLDVKLGDRRLVHARDVLSGRGEDRRNRIGNVGVHAGHPGVGAARRPCLEGGDERLGGHLQAALEDARGDLGLGSHACPPSGRHV